LHTDFRDLLEAKQSGLNLSYSKANQNQWVNQPFVLQIAQYASDGINYQAKIPEHASSASACQQISEGSTLIN
tara:strand:+ start:98 stop:316 length:219 start_codon:yes stop_codon:yes gene_type:complete